jgi:Ca2+-binding RTX toxin-like protein
VLTTRTVPAGQTLNDDVGDIAIAGSANGRINVLHTNFTDGDVDGEALVGVRTSTGDGADNVISGDAFRDFMDGGGGSDTLSGGDAEDNLDGQGDADIVKGNAASDVLDGGSGNDNIDGGSGDDLITGGAGGDELRGRGGADAFIFLKATDSGTSPAKRDLIVDFEDGDQINVQEVDADTTDGGDDAFVIDGDGSFSTGEIRITVINGDDLLVRLNNDTDAAADMAFVVADRAALGLDAFDFVL